jgi:ATP-dependent protease HslVU (ClpYQ) peptidase subunit
MTIICAYKDSESIVYGSDKRITFDSGTTYDVCKKWIQIGEENESGIIIGAAGSARLDNLIMSSAKNFGTAKSPYEIADLIKRAVIADTWKETKDEDGEPQSYNIDLLLICDGNIYRIGSDFSVTPIPEFTFVAAGSGENLALGAAFATKNKKPKEILKVAIQAAIKHDPNCGGTFIIDEIEL